MPAPRYLWRNATEHQCFLSRTRLRIGAFTLFSTVTTLTWPPSVLQVVISEGCNNQGDSSDVSQGGKKTAESRIGMFNTVWGTHVISLTTSSHLTVVEEVFMSFKSVKVQIQQCKSSACSKLLLMIIFSTDQLIVQWELWHLNNKHYQNIRCFILCR